jgi:3',5'-cyclic AMP phosphodiesterase CpdA
MNERFLLAQVSDMHIKAGGKLSYRVVDTQAALERCIAHVLRLPQRPDAILFTGDLTDFGQPDEYDNLARILRPLEMPVFLMPGNHDDPQTMRDRFASHAYLRQRTGKLDYAIDDFALRIVALDSTIPRQSGGNLDAAQLSWLDETLCAAPTKPTHRRPLTSAVLDRHRAHGQDGRSRNPADLRRSLRGIRSVERVIAGHLPPPDREALRRNDRVHVASPSHQVALDLARRSPSRFVMDPPAFQLHLWREGSASVSHTVAIGTSRDRIQFYEGGKAIDLLLPDFRRG